MSKKKSKPSPLEAWEELHDAALKIAPWNYYEGLVKTELACAKTRQRMAWRRLNVAISASLDAIQEQRKIQVEQRDNAWDLIAMAENMLLHHGKDMSPGDRSGREKVLEQARKLWYPRP